MTSRQGTIVTFYSFKGGTGRTMALANTAWILASNGFRVLLVDWDLESPGLHRYLHPLLIDPALRSTPGVIDILRGFASATLDPGGGGGATGEPVPAGSEAPSGGTDPEWYRRHARVRDHAVALDLAFPGDGCLEFLSAGVQDEGYSQAVSTFPWPQFYDRLGGGAFLQALREDMLAHYDYVLVDSRTGLSDSAGVCTVLMPDTVVNCFTLSAQGIEGAAVAAESVRKLARHRQIRILPVPMRVEDGEQTKLEAGRDLARNRFAPYLAGLDREQQERYWGDVEIPYKPFYAYEEIPATVGDRPRQENTLLAAFERLVARITDDRVTELKPAPEHDRRRLLAAYERIKQTIPSDVFISYAPGDPMWAEWTAAQLRAAGYRVELQRAVSHVGHDAVATLSQLAAGAGRIVALLSPDYARLPHARQMWARMKEQDPTGSERTLIPVRILDAPLPEPFSDLVAVDLVGVGEEEARELLLTAAGRPSAPVQPAADRAAEAPRFPGAVPPVWSVPSRNATFTGRGRVLEELRNRLSTGVTAVLPQALFGLGGVGKTLVALEYAYRFASAYDIVWWIPAEQTALISQKLAELAPHLQIPQSDNLTDTVEAVLDSLRRGRPIGRWLLIYDNAVEPGDLLPFIPQGAAGHVLVTSRNQDWAQSAEPVEVDVFSRDESVALLLRHNPRMLVEDAEQVAHELGDLPLAVGQAAAWLAQSGMPVATYFTLLKDRLAQLLTEQPSGSYDRSAAATWLLSVDRIREETPAAAELLQLCAFFGPDPIPLWLLYSDRLVSRIQAFDPDVRDPMLMGRLFLTINRYGLARPDKATGTISMHRLVAAVLRDQLEPEALAELRAEVHAILGAADPKDPDDRGNWERYSALLPHIQATRATRSADDSVRLWIINSIRYLWRCADHAGARERAEETLNAWVPRFGEDDKFVLLLHGQHTNALRSQGHFEQAYDIDVDVYARAQRTLGSDHPYSIMLAGSLGADLRSLGRYREARDMEQDTLTVSRQVLGAENERTLMTMNNLAVSEFLLGDLYAARELDRETLDLSREMVGSAHQSTLVYAGNYARDLRETGALQQALRLLQETVQQYRQDPKLGDDHSATLRAAKSLAVSLRKVGQYEAARSLTEDTYRRSQRIRGTEHPDTLACAANLACDLVAVGDLEGALHRAERTVERYRVTLGSRHPFTLATEANYSVYLRLVGRQEEARDLSGQTLERCREVLGHRHPYTLACAVNQASDLAAMSELDSAVALGRRTLEDYEATLGREHPDALACRNNLAHDLHMLGRHSEERTLHEEALDRARGTLGPGHPNVEKMERWQRLNCDIEPPPT